MKLTHLTHISRLAICCCLLSITACSTTHHRSLQANAGLTNQATSAIASGAGVVGQYDETDLASTGSADSAQCRPAPMLAGKDQRYFFDFNANSARAEASQSLRLEAKYLASHPRSSVRILGNADSRGSREYNIALGWRRCRAIAKFLQQYGVANNQMILVSYGAEKPVALGHDARAYQCNRRVDLHFIGKHYG